MTEKMEAALRAEIDLPRADLPKRLRLLPSIFIRSIYNEAADGLDAQAAEIARLRALLSAALPAPGADVAGEWVMVPRKPTPRMMAAGGPEVRKAVLGEGGDGNMSTIWAAMLAAAPKAPR